jgi:hippurate hydrolase
MRLVSFVWRNAGGDSQNIRTYNEGVRDHILNAVERICRAECEASNAPKPPEFTS